MSETLRILVATDNHLVRPSTSTTMLRHLLMHRILSQGVWERDPVRTGDSFQTFEEIFKIAKERKVDFVLLGGDLFHENKPSRNTVVRAMDILSKYCLGDDDIEFEILSDQTNLFTTGYVCLPHFSVYSCRE